MGEVLHYIQVILPLHLKWEPWYCAVELLEIGQRVRVTMAGKEYIAVVSRTSGTPKVDVSQIRQILSVEKELDRITPREIEFWRFIADYYLCYVGDVYKAAYPSNSIKAEQKRRVNKKLSLRTADDPLPALPLDAEGKPLLLEGWNRDVVYEQYVRACLNSGKDVLLLRPDYLSESYPTRREMAKMLRSDTPVLVEGSKSCIFLPFKKLGLVIIDEEHSVRYKHNASPRYNGRDAAIMLASIHHAAVILGSATPSLETRYNVLTGKYACRVLETVAGVEPEIIDTNAEKRKKGMIGDYSRRLLAVRQEVEDNGGRYLEVESWKLREALTHKVERYDLVALLHAEYLLSGEDFRSDEKAWQMLETLRHRCKGRLLIQTRNPEHPILKGEADVSRWMEERRDFNMPPFSRLVEIRSAGKEQQVLKRYFLPRDSSLKTRKSEILENTGPGCIIDVDPL